MGASAARRSEFRDTFLPFFSPSIGEEEIGEVIDTLRSGWLTTGPKARQFESEFAARVNSRHAIAVNSGTAALHLALVAHGVKAGDEVITTPNTFCATLEAIEYVGAKPVLVDIEPSTLNIDANRIERVVTPKTRAIIPVHFAGLPCDMDLIMDIANRYGLYVLEDAAHAVGATYKGKNIGSIGHATAFSFYANKNLTTAEGGMVTTDDDRLAEQLRGLSLHGISHDAWMRYSAEGSWFYEVLDLGYKYNLSDLQASLGIWQLRRLNDFIAIRERLAARYTRALSSLVQVGTPTIESQPGTQHAWHLYTISLDTSALTISRAQFIDELRGANVGASVHFIPIHFHPHYRIKFGWQPRDFPNAAVNYERTVSLPLYPAMSDDDVDYVSEVVSDIVKSHRR